MKNSKINIIKVFKALSLEKRVKILLILIKNKKGLHLSLISEKLRIPVQTVGRHILKLRNAGLVKSERYKNKMVYRIRPLNTKFDKDLILFIKKYLN